MIRHAKRPLDGRLRRYYLEGNFVAEMLQGKLRLDLPKDATLYQIYAAEAHFGGGLMFNVHSAAFEEVVPGAVIPLHNSIFTVAPELWVCDNCGFSFAEPAKHTDEAIGCICQGKIQLYYKAAV